MLPVLNIDIKEGICRAAYNHQLSNISSHPNDPISTSQQFASLCYTLSLVDSEWRHVALRHAWRTVYVDNHSIESALPEIRDKFGRYTRRMCIHVKFKSIASHYRRRNSFTQITTEFRPFCDLPLWPRLQILEIIYTHKCAFPGLAQYLEPRLANIHTVVVSGRVPIDMRRYALFLKSKCLREVNISSLPDRQDSLSTLSDPGDPILFELPSESITAISLSVLVDIRIVRSVLANTRHQLKKLELVGLCSNQLITAGISHPLLTTDEPSSLSTHPWEELESLSISLHIDPDLENVTVNFDADEFPQLTSLSITQSHPDSDTDPIDPCPSPPLSFLYGQTFTKHWAKLTHLRLLALNNTDVQMVIHHVMNLSTLHVVSSYGSPVFDARSLWLLLLSPLPLKTMSVDCQTLTQYIAELDFSLVRLNHPIREIHMQHVTLSCDQMSSLLDQCPRLSNCLNTGLALKPTAVECLSKTATIYSNYLAKLVDMWTDKTGLSF